jgi:hypothetical protein
VIDGLGVQRFDEAQVIHDLRGVRQKFAHPRAAPAVPLELERRPGQRQRRLVGGHAGETLPHAHRPGQFLSVHLGKLRLVVEQIHLRRPAAHEQVNDPLGAWREIRKITQPLVRTRRVRQLRRCSARRMEQSC